MWQQLELFEYKMFGLGYYIIKPEGFALDGPFETLKKAINEIKVYKDTTLRIRWGDCRVDDAKFFKKTP